MRYRLINTLFICTLLFAVNGCSTANKDMQHKKPGGEYMQDTFTIKAGGSYEECIEMKPGQVFDYDYDSSDFVNFNIHYHGEDVVYYPATGNGRMMGKGMIDPGTHDFYTKDQEFYCLMWDNLNSKPVTVSFSCLLRDK